MKISLNKTLLLTATALLAIGFTGSSCGPEPLTELRISRDSSSQESLLVANATKFLIENAIGTKVSGVDLNPEEAIEALNNHEIDVALEADPKVCNNPNEYPEYTCVSSIYADGNSQIAFHTHLKDDSEDGKRIVDLLQSLSFKARNIKKAFKQQSKKSLTENGTAAWLLDREKSMLRKALGKEYYEDNLKEMLKETKTQSE